jgi:hypothetical protein
VTSWRLLQAGSFVATHNGHDEHRFQIASAWRQASWPGGAHSPLPVHGKRLPKQRSRYAARPAVPCGVGCARRARTLSALQGGEARRNRLWPMSRAGPAGRQETGRHMAWSCDKRLMGSIARSELCRIRTVQGQTSTLPCCNMGIPIREGPARARCTLQACFRPRTSALIAATRAFVHAQSPRCLATVLETGTPAIINTIDARTVSSQA